jgi:hypothetical protein
MENISEYVTATAITSGLIAYLLGTQKHLPNIQAAANEIAANSVIPISAGLAFVQAVKQYLESLAYPRCTAGQPVAAQGPGAINPNVIWNGEVPLNKQGVPFRKRQVENAPGCPIPSTSSFYFITPNYTADISVLNAFTNTLKAETNATTFEISSSPSGNFIAYWVQSLTQSQVATYLSSPAVSVSLDYFRAFLT